MYADRMDPPSHAFEEGELPDDTLDDRPTLTKNSPLESTPLGPAAASGSNSSTRPAQPSPHTKHPLQTAISTQLNSFDHSQAYDYLAYLTHYQQQMSDAYAHLETRAYYHQPGFTSDQHHPQCSPPPHPPVPLEGPSSFFFDDSALPHELSQAAQLAHLVPTPEYQYSAQASHVLGASAADKSPHPSAIRRCFNCGDPSHALNGCPAPRNESLIRLTKQLFQAHRTDEEPDGTARTRLSADTPEDSLARRRALAASFYPGCVSATLREALFWERLRAGPDPEYLDPCRPMPWFEAMERWGYPPGYALPAGNEPGPLEAVLARLDQCETDGAWESTEVLALHRGASPDRASGSDSDSDSDEDEVILRLLVPGYAARSNQPAPLPPDVPTHSTPRFPDLHSLPALPGSPDPKPRRRLVRYAAGTFSSDQLPVFNGRPVARGTNCHPHAPLSCPDHSPLAQWHTLPSPGRHARRSPYDSPPPPRAAPGAARDAKGKRKRCEWRDAALRFAESRVQTGHKYVDQDLPSRERASGGGGLNYDDGPSSDEGGRARMSGGRTSDGSCEPPRTGRRRWHEDRPARRTPLRYDDAPAAQPLPDQSHEFALAKSGYLSSHQLWHAPQQPPLPDGAPEPVPAPPPPPEDGLDDMVMSEESE